MAFTLVIPDVSLLGHEWQELAGSRGSQCSRKADTHWPAGVKDKIKPSQTNRVNTLQHRMPPSFLQTPNRARFLALLVAKRIAPDTHHALRWSVKYFLLPPRSN